MAKIMKCMDGNTAASYVAYAFTDIAAIYPITPSSLMAENVDEWSSQGKKNIFGETVKVVEMQSEGGAAGTVHGALQCGSLATTFTASQGLLLMIPNMYRIAGELLPGVFHVTARTVATHATSIFGDHSDVMAVRQTGFAMLASSSVQEVMDLAGIAHLSAIKSRVPFLHFFDGFRTSHEVQKIDVIDYDDFASIIDQGALREFRKRALNPEHPELRGTVQNPDIFFQAREACNPYYEAIPDIVEEYMGEISKITGREYHPFNYYGAADAEYVLVAMGSVCETIEETIDFLVAKGEKVGLIKVNLYRPFSAKHFLKVLPDTVKKIGVLDRTKEPGALGEPLYEDVCTLFCHTGQRPVIVGGRHSLSSKDTTPSHIYAVFENLKLADPKNNFTVGILDDVTHTSLTVKEQLDTSPEGTINCKFWGFGSDGTVGANKSAIKIIGNNTDLFAQGYFFYDSKKSGGVTISHLRFGKKPIKSTYLINHADYIACHNQTYVSKYDILEGLIDGGIFLLACAWSPGEIEERITVAMKKYMAAHHIQFYTINAVAIAQELGLGGRINMIMQAAFFNLAKVIGIEDAMKFLRDEIIKNYGNKGENIVQMNCAAVDKALEALVKIEVPDSWKDLVDQDVNVIENNTPEFVKKIMDPINRQKGDSLPVSAFSQRADGTFPVGTSQYEKRGIAINIPEWISENCIQCNQCAYVCPHAAIRPFLLDREELKMAPEGLKTADANGSQLKGLKYRIQVSPLDCSGCGSCANVCSAKKKALVMTLLETKVDLEKRNWEFAMTVNVKDNLISRHTVKGSQFVQPLIEFSGACAGCGETPYAKLATQLFGDKMIIANATGCSLIWSASAPVVPYCTNQEGRGPAWANSLFEDNAEYGYGMFLSVQKKREKLASLMIDAIELSIPKSLKLGFLEWLNKKEELEASEHATKNVLNLMKNYLPRNEKERKIMSDIFDMKDYLVKKSVWLWGGDGWAYDIGFGGLDHVLASGEDINVLVFDTEVYSNTGGQASKSTPTGAVAKFTSSGKKSKKKDLGMIAMIYGNVYVAQVSMGADMNHVLTTFVEAERYKGPSLIIAYAPCINHGIKGGMGNSMAEAKKAVEAGYWHLYRYNPELKHLGENPFILDSKDPQSSYQDFLQGEVRYKSLSMISPGTADELFEQAGRQAQEKLAIYKKLSE